MSGDNALVSSDQSETDEKAASPEQASETGTEENQNGEAGDSENSGDEDQGEGSEKEAEGDGEKDAKPKTPWFERRLRQQTAKIAELARINEMQAQLLESLAANTQQSEGGEADEGDGSKKAKVAPQTATQAQIEAEARRIVEQQSFDNSCNTAFEQGVKAHGDSFKESVNTLQAMGVMDRTFIQAALDTEKASDVLHFLGQNPDEAERISSLTPTKMAIALDRIAAKASAKPQAPVSKAPAPVKPVGGKSANSAGDPDKMNMDDWLKWREAQLAKRNKR